MGCTETRALAFFFLSFLARLRLPRRVNNICAAMDLPAATMKRIMRELAELSTSPPEGIRVFMNEQNLLDIQAEIEGPQGTPFENGADNVVWMRRC